MVERDGDAGQTARMCRVHDMVEVTAAVSPSTSPHMVPTCADPPAHHTVPRSLTPIAPCSQSLS